MDIKEIIEGSELHYVAGKLIDEQSFEEMVDELSDKIDKEVSRLAVAYHLYLMKLSRDTCETKRKMEESGWNSACLEPNRKTFTEFCKDPEF